MKFRFRKPTLRISKRGKVSLSGMGGSFGGKNNRINLSKSGLSGTAKVGKSSFNTRRSVNCGFIVLLTLAVGLGGIIGLVQLVV